MIKGSGEVGILINRDSPPALETAVPLPFALETIAPFTFVLPWPFYLERQEPNTSESIPRFCIWAVQLTSLACSSFICWIHQLWYALMRSEVFSVNAPEHVPQVVVMTRRL